MAAAAPGIGMLAYAAYVRSLTGDWLAWVRVQQAWGRDSNAAPSLGNLINWRGRWGSDDCHLATAG